MVIGDDSSIEKGVRRRGEDLRRRYRLELDAAGRRAETLAVNGARGCDPTFRKGYLPVVSSAPMLRLSSSIRPQSRPRALRRGGASGCRDRI